MNSQLAIRQNVRMIMDLAQIKALLSEVSEELDVLMFFLPFLPTYSNYSRIMVLSVVEHELETIVEGWKPDYTRNYADLVTIY